MNEGCVPTKAMIRSAEVMHLVARRAAEFGVEVEGPVRFRLDRAVARKKAIVESIVAGIHGALDQRRGAIEFVRGEARFVSPHEVTVAGRTIAFDRAIIATGARRVDPRIQGIGAVGALNNRSALDLEALPPSLLVIGGGYVGIEFAQMYARFGSRVVLLGRSDRLAPGEDPELAGLLADRMMDEGIEIHTGATALSATKRGERIEVVAEVRGQERTFTADAVLVATGRRGHTGGLGLEAAGVAVDPKGFVEVNDELRTSAPHVWAIGDVKGGFMFTHVATYDGPIAALNAIRGLAKRVDYRVVPRVIYSDPVFASVGLAEEEARRRGHDVAVGRVPASGARARARGDGDGMLKAVVDRASREILGFQILSAHADDLIHEAVVAMHDHGAIERISKSIHAHPTLSEMVRSAARAAGRDS